MNLALMATFGRRLEKFEWNVEGNQIYSALRAE